MDRSNKPRIPPREFEDETTYQLSVNQSNIGENDGVEMNSRPGEQVRRIVEEFKTKLAKKNINPVVETDSSSEEEGEIIQSLGQTNRADQRKQYSNLRSISTPDLREPGLSHTLQRPKTISDDAAKPTSKRKESLFTRVMKKSTLKKKPTEPTVPEPCYKTVNIRRPPMCSGDGGALKGALFKRTNDKFDARWCLLRNDFFLCYFDKEYKNSEECLSLETVTSVNLIEESKFDFKVGDSKLFYFGIVTTDNRYVFGSTNKDIRNSWLQKIAESLNCKLIADLYEYEKIGWSYIREGINSEWFGAWFLLANRTLYYSIDNVVSTLDLRKIRAMKLQEIADDDILPHVLEEAPPYLLLDYQKVQYSLRCWIYSDTESWYEKIQQANKNGSRLDEQQLTSYDVPVIVEKCTNFLFLNGSTLKGIYRHNGQSSSVTEILNQFKNNAWSVHLTEDKHNVHDVATALKRFFRDLPEPLIPKKVQHDLMQIPYVDNKVERVEMYKKTFSSCPRVHYCTLKEILDHLHFIVSQSDKNQMTISNIASIWGVTIMNTIAESNESLVAEDHMLHILIADLINLYKRIFPENLKETQQKEVMKQVLDQFSLQPNLNSVKHAGDILMWIYVESKHGESYSVALNPQKTAYQVCSELSSRVRLPVHQLVLEEVVLNDSLIRPIHYSERVLDIVLKWNDWDDADRRNNCLIVSPIDKYNVYIFGCIVPVEGETKFADSEMKKFKAFTFTISDGDLHCYKDTMQKHHLFSLNIKDIIWYLGCNEVKRNPPTKHTITFISKYVKPTRTKANPYVGNVLAFPDEATKILWVSVLMKAAYSQGFLPPPQPTNIL